MNRIDIVASLVDSDVDSDDDDDDPDPVRSIYIHYDGVCLADPWSPVERKAMRTIIRILLKHQQQEILLGG